MSEEKKISDDELVEISGGADGPFIGTDDRPQGGPESDRRSDSGSPGGPGNTPESEGVNEGGTSELG